jgi:hypothetical protein
MSKDCEPNHLLLSKSLRDKFLKSRNKYDSSSESTNYVKASSGFDLAKIKEVTFEETESKDPMEGTGRALLGKIKSGFTLSLAPYDSK